MFFLHSISVLVAAGSIGATAIAQFPPTSPQSPIGNPYVVQQGQQGGQGQDAQQALQNKQMQRLVDPFGYDAFSRPFTPFRTGIEEGQGFPTFAPGIYPPAPAGWMQAPKFGPELGARLVLPVDPDWPTWVKAKLARELPYAPDKAILVRDTDRVWIRQVGEEAFVPLYFFDKLRAVVAGVEVEVRRTGSFQIVFHEGPRLSASGVTALGIEQMDADLVRIRIDRLTNVQLTVVGRAFQTRLPDGSELVVEPMQATEGRAEFRIVRVSEPGWFGGRARIFNSGLREITWRTSLGESRLAPGDRAEFLLVPSPRPIPTGLVSKDVLVETNGPVLSARARGTGGSLSWLGARFTLPASSSVQLDPLLGDPFAAKPPAPSSAPGKPDDH